MKPIILLSVMAIAIAGIGVGSLGNTITLDLQSLGVGDATLVSPIDNAQIKFNIEKFVGNQNNFKNVIADCIIESEDVIVKDSKIFCKLTDINGNVVAEGKVKITHTVFEGQQMWVDISPEDFAANKVQNVHDVVLVIQGP